MKMQFLADMQNPSRPPVEIKVSASKNHATIIKNVEKSIKIGDQKRERFFIDFYQFLADFGTPCGAEKRNKSKKCLQKRMPKKA